MIPLAERAIDGVVEANGGLSLRIVRSLSAPKKALSKGAPYALDDACFDRLSKRWPGYAVYSALSADRPLRPARESRRSRPVSAAKR